MVEQIHLIEQLPTKDKYLELQKQVFENLKATCLYTKLDKQEAFNVIERIQRIGVPSEAYLELVKLVNYFIILTLFIVNGPLLLQRATSQNILPYSSQSAILLPQHQLSQTL
jgi:hypothetical protein